MLFTLGQTAWAVGGMFMLGSGIVCAMLANSLTFACLSNTIDNFSQGNLEEDFMPRFDDFSAWDDVIHPFFLSIGAYLVSFAPLILIIVVSVFMMMNSLKSSLTNYEDAAQKVERSNIVIEQMDKQAAERNQRLDGVLTGNTMMPNHPRTEEEEIKQVEEMINQHRQAQIESVAGKSPETVQMERDSLIKQFLDIGAFTMLLLFVAFLWGIFYFPAACAVAGYTRSFVAVINPLVGLDTIRRMGFNYVKILAMCLVLGILSFAASFFLELIFLPFDLPKVGNMPAKIVGGVFTFYFSVVFSVTIGYALYKSSDRLNFYRG
jgi:ABC-type multidrug transport system fused ATPase/permease subunit